MRYSRSRDPERPEATRGGAAHLGPGPAFRRSNCRRVWLAHGEARRTWPCPGAPGPVAARLRGPPPPSIPGSTTLPLAGFSLLSTPIRFKYTINSGAQRLYASKRMPQKAYSLNTQANHWISFLRCSVWLSFSGKVEMTCYAKTHFSEIRQIIRQSSGTNPLTSKHSVILNPTESSLSFEGTYSTCKPRKKSLQNCFREQIPR